MILLRRDRQTMWYATLNSVAPATDSSGHRTGEQTKTYSDPVAFIGNCSIGGGEKSGSDTGYAAMSETGLREVYSHVVLASDMTLPIDVDSLLWIGISPTDSDGNSVPANYVCRARLKGFNHMTYKVRSVKTA